MGFKVYHKSLGGREDIGDKTLKEKPQEQLASYPNWLDNVDMTSKFNSGKPVMAKGPKKFVEEVKQA